MSCADYNRDGRTDVLIINELFSRLYRSSATGFVETTPGIPGGYTATAVWGDYNNDAKPDVAFSGNFSDKLYKGDGSGFTAGAVLPDQLSNGCAAWGDYDNDGDIDIVQCGYNWAGRRSCRVSRNDGGSFVSSGLTLQGLQYASAAWGDYDDDGDLDLAATGYSGSADLTKVYRNDDGALMDIDAQIPGARSVALAWVDADNDGYLDLAVGPRIFRGGTGAFPEISSGLPACKSLCWGDFDNDGDSDVVLLATQGSSALLAAYVNSGDGTFQQSTTMLPSVTAYTAAAGDFDGDGDLDVTTQEPGPSGTYYVHFYRNDTTPANRPPSAPTDLVTESSGSTVTLRWSPSTDAQTPGALLTYNLRIGTTPGGDEVCSGMADGITGLRRIPADGNAGRTLSWKLQLHHPLVFYWSVQAVDSSYAGSAWAPEQFVRLAQIITGCVRGTDGAPLAGATVTASNGGTSAVTGADGTYGLYVPVGWTGIVTASKSPYAMLPRERSYVDLREDIGGQDFDARDVFAAVDLRLPANRECAAAWGDYDSDGDLDLALMGNTGNGSLTAVYRNDPSGFTKIDAPFIDASSQDVRWIDFDGDGDLDLSTSRTTISSLGNNGTRIYRNDSLSFVDIVAAIPMFGASSLDWGDCDNDGDYDLLIVSGSRGTKAYRNQAGVFADIGVEPVTTYSTASAWIDYDNDGDLDLAAPYGDTTYVYRNDDGVFSLDRYLTDRAERLAVGDYDGDGDLDIAMLGSTLGSYGTKVGKIQRNNGDGTFTEIYTLPYLRDGAIAWGDYDNDGDLDLAWAGNTDTSKVTRIYRCDNGQFSDSGIALAGVSKGTVAWGDYDSDDDLDLFVGGQTSSGYTTTLYVNQPFAPERPQPPTGLQTAFDSRGAVLSWTRSAAVGDVPDANSYNIRVGTTPGGSEVCPAMANASGHRLVAAVGNVQKNCSWAIRGLEAGTYYWAAQAVDGAFIGSEWAEEQTFTLVGVSGHVRTAAREPISGVTVSAENANWTITGPDGYFELGVPSGWSGRLTAARVGYSFAPSERTCSAVTQDLPDQDFVGSGGFCDTGPVLTGAANASLAWADFDLDGDLDLAAAGDDGATYFSQVFANTAGILASSGAQLPGAGAMSVLDYDNSNAVDLLLGGLGSTSTLYANDSGALRKLSLAVPAFEYAGLGDFDNDGRTDLAVAVGSTTTIYRYSGWGHEPTGVSLPYCRQISCGDIDGDGDLDLMLGGCGTYYPGTPKYYRNDGGLAFVDSGASFPESVGAALGDFDSDGDLDVATSTGAIYQNTSGAFSCVYPGVDAFDYGCACWGDFDNDGDLDLIQTGRQGYIVVSRLLRNDGGTWTPMDYGFPQADRAAAAWGDVDGDGDLDLALAGDYLTRVFRNDAAVPNTPPSTPETLQAVQNASGVTFSWSASTDAQTPSAGLTYNLRVGTTPGGNDIVSGLASSTGARMVAQTGNAQNHLSRNLAGVGARTLYWSVQAVDACYAGSAWAAERVFAVQCISGRLATASGAPIPGAAVALDNGDSAVRSDVDGRYGIAVPPGWSGSVTPSRPGYSFTPASRSYTDVQTSIEGQDFVGGGGFAVRKIPITGPSVSSVAWADYDYDGDMDLAICEGSPFTTSIYRNDGGEIAYSGIQCGKGYSCAWGDYDSDGDADLAVLGGITGWGGIHNVEVYLGGSGGMSLGPLLYTAMSGGTIASADYNNDGAADLIQTYGSAGPKTRFFRNAGGSFLDSGISAIGGAAMSIGDYDRDADHDVAVVGKSPRSVVLKNTGGTFSDASISLPDCYSVAWGDYDNDGDLDLALAGNTSSTNPSSDILRICRNDAGTFVDTASGLTGGPYGGVAWGDYDNDGDLDLAAAMSRSSTSPARLYRNDNGSFVDVSGHLGLPLYAPPPFTSGPFGTANWCDYDRDGDLDLLIAGSMREMWLCRNDCPHSNAAPTTPAGLSAQVSGTSIAFAWQAASDPESPPLGLTYNLRVGTRPGASDVCSGMANLTSGSRLLPAPGNAQKCLSWALDGLGFGTYYWSVQAVDAGYTASPWAPEQVYVRQTVAGVKACADNTNVGISNVSVTAVFPDCVYVESVDRSAGVKVTGIPGSVSVGARLSVSGAVKTGANGERYVGCASFRQDGSAPLAPLAMSNCALGGGDGEGQEGVWGWYLARDEEGCPVKRWMLSPGMNNIGLLVRLWGRVVSVDPSAGAIVIDDGSNNPVRCLLPSGVVADPTSQYLAVTGISSCEKRGDELHRLLRIREQSDIVEF